MSEPLVIDHAHEYLSLERHPVDAGVHILGAVVVVPVLGQQLREVLDRVVVLVRAEGLGLLDVPVQGPDLALLHYLPGHAFDKHPDGHARRKCVRVDYHVRTDARLRKRHVDLTGMVGVNRGSLEYMVIWK